jgi:chromosome partitioning protein
MARVFCIANQKGGVGKTTTTVNLAAGLAKLGQEVLVIDLDPQGNATMGSGVEKSTLTASTYEVLLGSCSAAQSQQYCNHCSYFLIGANRELAGADIDLVDLDKRENRLRKAIQPILSLYDFILIDCPPSLNLLALNGLCCADGIIVPMQCEYFALEGLSDLVNSVKWVKRNFNPQLGFIGLLRVMFDTRITLQQQVSKQLKEHFGDKVFNTVIPRNIRLAEAPSHGLAGVVYDPSARGAKAYMEFAKEFLDNIEKLIQS